MFESHYKQIEEVIAALEIDLVGPKSEDEIISDPPITRYVSGILFPGDSRMDSDQDFDQQDDYDEVAQADPAVALANIRNPVSMGITFAVDTSMSTQITVEANAAFYEPLEEPTSDDDANRARALNALEKDPKKPLEEEPDADAREPETRAVRSLPERWRRHRLPMHQMQIDLTEVGDHREEVGRGLELFVRVRGASGGLASVTTVLVNRRIAASGWRDADAFFQPSLSVSSPSGASCFTARETVASGLADQELDSYRLLYREAATFAVGHGCSATWSISQDDEGRATSVESTFVPRTRVNVSDSNPDIAFRSLSMREITEGDRSEVLADLNEFTEAYRAWIRVQEEEIGGLPDDLQEAAHRNLADCRAAADRMKNGITALEDNLNWEAFRLANHAMWLQRDRADWIDGGAVGPGPAAGSNQSWRPFQLAFILMCLPGIADSSSPDRQIADLLWFPTGGGKTEAYLGLIAFTAIRRRLIDPANGGGVTALMRYTMRLLTLQQFERAAALMCALEIIREDVGADTLGDDRFSIGLWVGKPATPNDLKSADDALAKLRRGVELHEENPVQLHSCPWCGTSLEARDYWIPSDKTRLVVTCGNKTCAFGRDQSAGKPMSKLGLPVHLVDEDLYNFRPTLVVATVDKFAALPWMPRVGDLFNIDHPEPPPELIIQDELHLISGPLGTLTALYETVIDVLCTSGGNVPKVVASTATIRRAGRQAEGIFARGISQFPPAGLSARDSFFAREAPASERGARTFVGVMAPGKSHTTLMVRAYASLLQTVAESEYPETVKDPYWTLVGYFNSLRVLGGARMQVQDDVGDRIEMLAASNETAPRTLDQVIELTSREPSSKIPSHLRQMGVSYGDSEALDVILATNMISVGVDINRLGLMVLMGQPPSTSEYIQATSRVGRRNPGLILDIFNAARSRDRSHYESFVGYHTALYRQVESTSVTPFSPRARDRALHALVIAFARLQLEEFRPNKGAQAILSGRGKLERVKQLIIERAEKVDPSEVAATASEIDAFLDAWEGRALEQPDLVYSNRRHPEISLLGDAIVPASDPSDPRPTLWSLRDVDASSNLFL